MKFMKLAIAAAIVVWAPAAASASAPAEGKLMTSATADAGTAAKRPGWRMRRVCTTVTRHHHRERVCRMVRVRR